MSESNVWQKTRGILKIIFSILLLAGIVSVLKIHLLSVFVSIKNIPIVYIIAASFIYLIAVIVSSLKWKLFLPGYSVGQVLKYTFVGQFYSVVLPGQFVGEEAKAYRLGSRNKNVEEIGASVLLDKVTGILSLLLVACAGIVLTSSHLPSILFFSIVVGLLICLCVLIVSRTRRVYSFIHRRVSLVENNHEILGTVWRFIRTFTEHWHGYTNKTGMVVGSIGVGIIYQLLTVAFIAILASGLHMSVSFFDWAWIFGVVSISVFIPITIGGIGLREGVFVGLLSLLHVSPELAVSLSLSSFAFQLVGALIGGIFEVIDFKQSSK